MDIFEVSTCLIVVSFQNLHGSAHTLPYRRQFRSHNMKREVIKNNCWLDNCFGNQSQFAQTRCALGGISAVIFFTAHEVFYICNLCLVFMYTCVNNYLILCKGQYFEHYCDSF